MSTNSASIARLVGPTLVAVTVSETLNHHIWAASNAATIFVNGTTLFAAGLAIILQHNLWVTGWPVLITAVGWGAMALGLARMVWPDRFLELAGVQGRSVEGVAAPAAVVGLVGAWISFKVVTS
ncbi:hypothetical protein MKEN_01038900 [Mycena kentingensis (nom. inval.)]|nr:hypothetical protein MKEN_01038900 [Mycena kentingensis (nom. inval.)]